MPSSYRIRDRSLSTKELVPKRTDILLKKSAIIYGHSLNLLGAAQKEEQESHGPHFLKKKKFWYAGYIP